jgi:hypothetical protein
LGAACVLALVAAGPVRADSFDDFLDDLKDELVDTFFEAWDAWLESIEDYLFKPQADMPSPGEEIHGIAGVIGSADNSYLRPDGADLGVLYPEDGPRTIDDGQEYAEQRRQDRLLRVDEAMRVASTIAAGLPATAERLDALDALNHSPASILGAAQLGAKAGLETARAVNQLAGVVAELGQLQADEAARQEWVARESQRTSMERIGPLWTGERRFSTEFIPLDF